MPWRDLPVRRHTRLPGWDYRSPGPYAITIYTQHREWFFGGVVDGRVVHTAAGRMVVSVWREMAVEFPRVALDAFVLMPNHLHAIVCLSHEGPAGNPTLGDVVQRFKSITTARYSAGVHEQGWPPYDRRLWQTSYYEHIVRDRADLDRCRRYIAANPARWDTDRDRNPERPVPVSGRAPLGEDASRDRRDFSTPHSLRSRSGRNDIGELVAPRRRGMGCESLSCRSK